VSGQSGKSVGIAIDQEGIEKILTGSHLLIATGRTPNTERLGLELAGVELTNRGYIKVNERLQTTAPGVWAIGEVAGSPQFTHISVDDFRVVHANITRGSASRRGDRFRTACLLIPSSPASASASRKRQRKASPTGCSRSPWR